MDSIENVLSAYSEAERAIKNVELKYGQLSVPAINELRYAGSHIVKSMSFLNEEEKNKELYSAIKHCKKATHNAYEVSFLSTLDSIKLLKVEIGKNKIQNDEAKLQLKMALGKVEFLKNSFISSQKAGLAEDTETLRALLTQLNSTYKKIVAIYSQQQSETLSGNSKLRAANSYFAVATGLVSLSAALLSFIVGV